MAESQNERIMYCIYCGTKANPDGEYCWQCGKLLVRDSSNIIEHKSSSVALASSSRPLPVQSSESKKSRVGGWLVLLILGLMIFGPFHSISMSYSNIIAAEREYPNLIDIIEWSNFKTASWVIIFSGIALSVYGSVCLGWVRKWRVVKEVKIIIWVVGPVLHLILNVLLPLWVLGDTGLGNAQYGGFFAGQMIALVVSATIWTMYLTKSKRVKNTYQYHELVETVSNESTTQGVKVKAPKCLVCNEPKGFFRGGRTVEFRDVICNQHEAKRCPSNKCPVCREGIGSFADSFEITIVADSSIFRACVHPACFVKLEENPSRYEDVIEVILKWLTARD